MLPPHLQALTDLSALLAQHPDLETARLASLLRVTPRSVVARGSLDGGQVVFKRFMAPDAPAIVREQARVLTRMAQHMTDDLAVMAVARSFPEIGLSVLHAAKGQTVTQLLNRATPARRANLLALAGAWLAQLTQTDAVPGPFDALTWRDHCLTIPAAAPLWDTVRQLAQQAHGQTVQRSFIHGDYNSSNLICAGSTLCGIDIQNDRWTAIARDAARFLLRCEHTHPTAGADRYFGIARAHWVSFLTPLPMLHADIVHVLPLLVGVEICEILQNHPSETANHARLIQTFLATANTPPPRL